MHPRAHSRRVLWIKVRATPNMVQIYEIGEHEGTP